MSATTTQPKETEQEFRVYKFGMRIDVTYFRKLGYINLINIRKVIDELLSEELKANPEEVLSYEPEEIYTPPTPSFSKYEKAKIKKLQDELAVLNIRLSYAKQGLRREVEIQQIQDEITEIEDCLDWFTERKE